MERGKDLPSNEKLPMLFSNTVNQESRPRLPIVEEHNEPPFPRRLSCAPIAGNASIPDTNQDQVGSSSFPQFGSGSVREKPVNSIPHMNHSANSRSTLSSSGIHPVALVSTSLDTAKPEAHTVDGNNNNSINRGNVSFRELNNSRVKFSPPPASLPKSQPSFRLRQCHMLPRSSALQTNGPPPIHSQRTSILALTVPAGVSVSNAPTPRAISATENRERTRPEQTFESLVRTVLHHRMFPLIFKGVYETSVGSPPVITNRRSEEAIRRTSLESHRIEIMARHEGVQAATKNIEAIDMFFAVMNAAFIALQAPEQPPIPGPLHSMISACDQVQVESRAVNSDASSNPSQPWENRNIDATTVRSKLSDEARQKLERWFNEHFENPYPTDPEKRELARECGLQLNQINNFFGNKRMRLKRKALEERSKTVPGDTNQAPYEASVLPARSKWRAIVLPKKNGNEPARVTENESNSHDALVSGLFQGTDNTNEYRGGEKRQRQERW